MLPNCQTRAFLLFLAVATCISNVFPLTLGPASVECRSETKTACGDLPLLFLRHASSSMARPSLSQGLHY